MNLVWTLCVKGCKSVNNFLLPPPPPDMKGELRKPTVIGGLKIKSRNLLTFLACNPLQKLNPPFAQNLTSEVSLTKSYGFGLRAMCIYFFPPPPTIQLFISSVSAIIK